MEEQHKSVSLAILGVVAVIAVVGLVLLFVQQNSATGQVYGGALKGDPFPYWSNRGTPRNVPDMQFATGWTNDPEKRNAYTNWNWYAISSRSPKRIHSVLTGYCGRNAFITDYAMAEQYEKRGYQVVEPMITPGDTKGAPGMCVIVPGTMIGGIAG